MKPTRFLINSEIAKEIVLDFAYSPENESLRKLETELFYKKDKYFLKIECVYHISGYTEPETNGFVETISYLDIQKVELWDFEGDPVEAEWDEEEIKKLLK